MDREGRREGLDAGAVDGRSARTLRRGAGGLGRNPFGGPRSPEQTAVQRHLSKVYARVAAATMSSINSVSTSTPCQSVNFEGGAWPPDSRLQESEKLDAEELHSAQKSVASTSSQVLQANAAPAAPANRWDRKNQNHTKNHARIPTNFMPDGRRAQGADEGNK